MNIEILIVEEHKDGSATAKVNFDKQAHQVIMQWGLIGLLTQGLDEYAVRPSKTNFSAKKRNTEKKGK